MVSTLCLTLLGADRPGLVQLVADRVAVHGGNWLESRLCRLGGQFAGIIRVTVPSEGQASLCDALVALEVEGLRVVLHSESLQPASASPAPFSSLEIIGHDRPGIVRQITGVLAAHGVNVEEFASECVNAPMDGTQLFQAKASILIPPGVSLGTLRSELEKIAADLMVDIQLRT